MSVSPSLCRQTLWLLALLFIFSTVAVQAAVYKVVPGETDQDAGVYSFSEAISLAEKGDTLLLGPGVYPIRAQVTLAGTSEHPIKIIGSGPDTRIESPTPDLPACLVFRDSHFVELHHLHISNCGDVFIALQDSSYFTFKNIDLIGGKYPILARGDGSHHILLDAISWNQDPSGAMYGDIPWSESHHGEYVHFNGSLIYAKGIPGSIILRNSRIRNAFNGIRMKGHKDKVGLTNMNVEIYNNLFENIRDNPVEPEVDATNWWMHHNKIRDAHAYFSFTEVAGGHWYVFRNIGVSEKVLTGENTGGKILKFEDHGPLPTGPFMVFNNSWLGPRPIATGGESRHLQYLNNAHQFTGKITPLKQRSYHETYHVKNNILNTPFGIDALDKDNIYRSGFAFEDKVGLRTNHPALLDAGMAIRVNDYPVQFSGAAPDIGAYELEGVSDYPPFRFYDKVYQEHPRIVKIDRTSNSLRLWSSVPLQVSNSRYATLVYKNGKTQKLRASSERYTVLLDGFDVDALEAIHLPEFMGLNNLKMRAWGAVETDFKILFAAP